MNKLKHFIFIILIAIITFRVILTILPFPELDTFFDRHYSLKINDRNGYLLNIIPLYDGFRREYISGKNIPEKVSNIFIRSEDKRFYYHSGIDIIAFIRALFYNIQKGRIVTGGSTITMQLARLIAPHKKGLSGKFKEIFIALRLEILFSKEKILEYWFNSIPFGNRAIGIESGSKIYFGKNVGMLNEIEACILAIIPRRPYTYNPFTKRNNIIPKVKKLAMRVLSIPEENIIGQLKYILDNMKPYKWPNCAPHFVGYIRNEISNDELSTGKDIYSSLDISINTFLESKINNFLNKYKKNRLTNGSAIVLDNRSGEILGYIGSRDFFNNEYSGQIDGVHILNQPGSCLKPFLYAYALEKGYYPNSIIPDIPSTFGTDQIYSPHNFNNRFHGPVRFRVALASSLNVPAVHLITQIGVDNFSYLLKKLSFDSLKEPPNDYGCGLALGNADISLFELARAFSIFPRDGIKLKITTRKQNKDFCVSGDRIFGSYSSRIICDILSDNASRALGFTEHSILNTDFPAIFKTGTSDKFGNIWTVGATSNYTVGIWLGNFDGSTVIGHTGSSIPARIAIETLSLIDKHPREFQKPLNVRAFEICCLSGGLATKNCPGTRIELLPATCKITPCEYHFSISGKVAVKYPPLYFGWAKNQKGLEASTLKDLKEDLDKTLYIRHPADGSIFYYDPGIPAENQSLKIEIIWGGKKEDLSIFINDIFTCHISYPYLWYFPLKRGKWKIEVKLGDYSDNIYFSVL